MRTRFLRGTTAENNSLTLPAGEIAIDTERKAVRLHDGTTPDGFECVGTKAYAPPVGPGPEVLQAGDTQLGYYGELSNTELFTPSQLRSQVGLSAGQSTPGSVATGWLKFAYQGKILFVSKQVLNRSWSGNNIFRANLEALNIVYGGQSAPLVTKDTFQFIPRLLTGGDADPASTSGGEWNDLIYRVHVDDPTGSNWAGYTNQDLDINIPDGDVATSCQEYHATSTASHVLRGGYRDSPNSIFTFETSQSLGGNHYAYWRPVLELVQ